MHTIYHVYVNTLKSKFKMEYFLFYFSIYFYNENKANTSRTCNWKIQLTSWDAINILMKNDNSHNPTLL